MRSKSFQFIKHELRLPSSSQRVLEFSTSPGCKLLACFMSYYVKVHESTVQIVTDDSNNECDPRNKDSHIICWMQLVIQLSWISAWESQSGSAIELNICPSAS